MSDSFPHFMGTESFYPAELSGWAVIVELLAGCIEVFKINMIARPSGCSLHLSQSLYRADGDLDAENLSIDRRGTQLWVGRYAVEPLNNVQQAQFGLNRYPLSGCQLRSYRERRAEKRLLGLDVTVSLHSYLCKALEVLGVRCDHDVEVLCASDNSPSIDCETTNQDEIDICLGEPAKKLIEGRLGQSWRAAPTNRIS